MALEFDLLEGIGGSVLAHDTVVQQRLPRTPLPVGLPFKEIIRLDVV